MARKATAERQVVSGQQLLDEAAKLLHRIGQEQRKIEQVQSQLNEAVGKLQAKAITEGKPHQTRISQLSQELYRLSEANREELTEQGKRKMVELPTGVFGWRLTPLSVLVDNEEKVMAAIKSLGLKQFIRVKEDIDKQAMLKEREVSRTIEGVSFKRDEKFVIKPEETKVEIIAAKKELK